MRTLILIILGFCFLSCEAQIGPAQSALYYKASNDTTEVSWWLGDSIIAGYNDSEGPGTAPVANSTYQSDGTTISLVTSDADFSTVLTGEGSAMGQYAHDQFILTGKKQVIIPTGFSGSDFIFENNADHWGTGGNLYGPAKTKADNTLTLLNKNKLDRIIMCLGTNDASGTAAINDVRTGIDDFFDKLVADFPGVPILVIQPGAIVSTTATGRSRRYEICRRILYNADRLADVHIVNQLYPYVEAGLISADGVHPGVNGMNMLGSRVSKWNALGAYGNKFVRGLLSSFFDDISTAHAALVQTFVLAEIANGNYLNDTESFYFLKSETERNTYIDWTLRGNFLVNDGATFTANDGIETNGTSTTIRPLYSPGINIGTGMTYQDLIVGADILSNSSSGVVGRAIGWSDGATSAIALTQLASSLTYQECDATASAYGTDTSIQNVFYTLRRTSSTSKNLDKDFTNVNTVSVTAVNPPNQIHNIAFGAMNSNGTLSQFLALKFRAILLGRGSTFDGASFKTNYDALDAGW